MKKSVFDFEEYAKSNLSSTALKYISGSAFVGQTYKDNVQAFSRWRIQPRLLRDLTGLTTSTSLLGKTVPSPICIAPSAAHKLVYPDGEIATARAAARLSTCYASSFWTTVIQEDIVSAAPDVMMWAQINVIPLWKLVPDYVRRLENLGCSGLVASIDCPVYSKFTMSYNRLDGISWPNFDYYEKTMSSGIMQTELYKHHAIDWSVVQKMKSMTKMPVILKGIVTAEDAELAASNGADAIIVSNHGGRQLDGVQAAIDMLPSICDAVAGRCEVYMDGGVRSGHDVFKALALGARAVFVGRPVLWALCYKGEDGVVELLDLMNEELRTTMGMSGCRSIADINRSMVIHESHYPKL